MNENVINGLNAFREMRSTLEERIFNEIQCFERDTETIIKTIILEHKNIRITVNDDTVLVPRLTDVTISIELL